MQIERSVAWGVLAFALAFIGWLILVTIFYLPESREMPSSNDQNEAITGDPDSLDTHTVERSYVKIDDSLFVCLGDIALHVSDVGVITFDCNRVNGGLQRVITNPSELFVRQTLRAERKITEKKRK